MHKGLSQAERLRAFLAIIDATTDPVKLRDSETVELIAQYLTENFFSQFDIK